MRKLYAAKSIHGPQQQVQEQRAYLDQNLQKSWLLDLKEFLRGTVIKNQGAQKFPLALSACKTHFMSLGVRI
jgi:hypothetical protein